MAFSGPPAPSREIPIDPATQLFRVPWLTWFRDVRTSLNATPSQVPGGKVQLTNQTATIASTPIPTADLAAGLYRVSWYAQVITPAVVSSSFRVTVAWTRNGVAQSVTGTLENGNLTTTFESNGELLIHIDGATPVSFAVAYASNPAAAMVFELNVMLELVSAD